jgi:hypothetical protein
MKFKAVDFMRETKNKIYKETKNLPYEKQKEYLAKHSEWVESSKSSLFK